MSIFTQKEFICGWGAAVTNIVLTYPIQKIGAYQVLHNVDILTATKLVIEKNNIRMIYRGMLPPLCQKSLSISLMFGFYNNMNKYLRRKNVKYARYYSGITSGTMESLIMPFERMQSILIQDKFNSKYKNMGQLATRLYKEYGFKEYYRGFSIIYFRNTVGNVFFFNLKTESDLYITEKFKLPILQTAAHFLHGGMIGASISTFFYPLTVMKLTIHKQIGSEFESPLKTIQNLYTGKQKLRRFYKGGLLNFTRSFFSWGIINSFYEFYMKFFD